MSDVGTLTMVSTNAQQFRASGEAAHLRRWLTETRQDMTSEACRQVVWYARKFIDLFGAEAPALITGPAGRIRERLDAVDLPSQGLARETHRHLLRAAMALHAAAYDLDTATAVRVMDRRTPQRRPSTGGIRHRGGPLPSADLLDDTVPVRGEAATQRHAESAGAGDQTDLPEIVRPVVEAVSHGVTAQLRLDDAIDVRTATRAVLQTLSPAARVQIAAALPQASELPVAVRAGTAAATVADLAEDAVVALMEQRHVDLRIT